MTPDDEPAGPALDKMCSNWSRVRSLRRDLSRDARSPLMLSIDRTSDPATGMLDLLSLPRLLANSQRPGSPSAGCLGEALQAQFR